MVNKSSNNKEKKSPLYTSVIGTVEKEETLPSGAFYNSTVPKKKDVPLAKNSEPIQDTSLPTVPNEKEAEPQTKKKPKREKKNSVKKVKASSEENNTNESEFTEPVKNIEEWNKKSTVQKHKINIEARNAMEEVKEILSPCIKCGMCKSLCPVFKTLKKEEISPRGHSIMLNENILNDLVFQCNLCKACEAKCPLNLKICDAMKRAREALVLDGKGLESNKEMIEAIRKSGSPFATGEKVDPDKLYCC